MRLNFHATGDGPTLIILHGFLGSLDNWWTVAQRLGARFRVMTLDLRNHGHSPHHRVMSYPAMAEDIHEFLDQQSIASAYVLGHSMGGKVAMQLATTRPQRIDKMIVVDIAPKGYPATHESTLVALRSLDLGSFKSFGEIDSALAPQIPSADIRGFLMKNLTRQGDAGFRWRIDLEAITSNYVELTKPIAPKRAFAKPVCFVRGDRSDYLREEDFPLINKMFPRAIFVTIPHAGHWVHVDAAEDFLKTVTEFLDPHSSSPHYSRLEEKT
ncbi:MAG: alpha/beta fold hydrolase [Deltaproteobacteria bacterium]